MSMSMTVTYTVVIRKMWAKQVPTLRPNILAVQMPEFGGAKRKALPARKTGTKRSRKGTCTSGYESHFKY